MNTTIKTSTGRSFLRSALVLITLLLACFALSPGAQAVSPPPDGGYAGGNTAEGTSALLSLTTGLYNTAIGFDSLLSNGAANFSTGVGAGALLSNTADSNTAVGAAALLSNTTGGANTAIGAFALFSNTTGSNNTATGDGALHNNTATSEFFICSSNTANGASALFDNTTGDGNTGIGVSALHSNTTGTNNTASGYDALETNATGSNNTALGYLAGHNLTTGDSNIDIGANVGGVAGESNTIRIGNTDITDTFIRGISGTTVASGANVLVAANGHLGTLTSSKRFKEGIKPMDKASEALFSLKPVTFRYKKEIDPAGTQQFGLVAEDVEKVSPELVVRDENGKVNSVRYEQVNAMLLNEFLKAHRKIQEQEATITQLRKQMEIVIAHAKDQDSKIQKVSAQIEISKAGPGVVKNDSRSVESNTNSQ